MKRILILLLFSTILMATPNITSYLYEYKDGKLTLIQKSDRPLIAKKHNQIVINVDRGKEPTQEQLNGAIKSVQDKMFKKNVLTERIFTETEIQKIIEDYLNSEKGKTKIKEIINTIKWEVI